MSTRYLVTCSSGSSAVKAGEQLLHKRRLFHQSISTQSAICTKRGKTQTIDNTMVTRAMMKKKETTAKRATQARQRQRAQRGGSQLGPGLRSLSYTASNPGIARIRGAFEVPGDATGHKINFSTDMPGGFTDWCGQAHSLLTPFMFFRLSDVSVRAEISGGAATTNAIMFNVSNNGWSGDSAPTSILDDDYATVTTATHNATLRPPMQYWRDGARNWYLAVAQVSSQPGVVDLNPATVSYRGDGIGGVPAPLAGWLIIDMVIQFHTLA